MIDIAKKRLPSGVMLLFVYLTYCAANWYVMRGSMAYYGERYGFPAWIANDAVSLFLGGLVPFALYVLISSFCTRSLSIRLRGRGDVSALRYGVHITVIAANTVLFLLKFIFLAAPLYASLLNIIFDPVVTVLFVALYLWYAFKREYVEKCVFGVVVTQVMGAFITVYALASLIMLITAVAA